MIGSQMRGKTECLMHCALAAGTTSTISTTGTTHFAIGGKTYTKAAMTNAATPTADANTGAAFTALAVLEGTVVVIGLDKDGNVKAAQGTIQDLDVNENFITAPEFPNIPETMCPIGYGIFKNGSSGSAWTFGTSSWSATDLADAFVSVATLPLRPQVS